jgi:anti-sigma regulatory factor (Ser/Thr protein kinase)
MDASAATNLVVLKNSLQGDRQGRIQDLEVIVNGSDTEDWTSFLEQEEKTLSKKYGGHIQDPQYRADFGGKVAMVLAEAITNYQFYANKGDHDTPLFVYRWQDDNRLYYCIKGCGDGFDPRTVTVTLPLGVDPLKARIRKEGPGKGRKGGWGHRIMAALADFIAYDPDGKSMYLFFELPAHA